MFSTEKNHTNVIEFQLIFSEYFGVSIQYFWVSRVSQRSYRTMNGDVGHKSC